MNILSREIANAMRYAREATNMKPEQFARELMRLVPELPVEAVALLAMEAGMLDVDARHLVAAARIAEQPTSAVLGELDLYEATIPRLEARIEALEARLERAGKPRS
jgi:hypothetical protein